MTTDSLDDRILAFRDLHLNIARDTFPNGGMLLCQSVLCSYTRSFTVEEAGHFLRDGWPKHCGQTMMVQTAPKTDARPSEGMTR